MLQLVYILAFTVIAFFAISNLIRSLITLSADSRRGSWSANKKNNTTRTGMVPHPELLDEWGKPINEPLLVMRSVSVEDARQKLDNLYNSSPNQVQDENEQ